MNPGSLFLTPGPEQTVRDMLSHTGSKTLLQGLPGKFLCLVDRGERIQALGQQTGNARSQGAA